ncbi:MAG: orotate phosphoribosyltransferase [candidate division Zixibacteria bacterium]|nr:orotate phosphoribosyltransferase [candidate division Zixibacteria bacterium]
MSEKDEVLEIFTKSGALLKGHFLLSSGLHSDEYFEKFQVLQYPHYVETLCKKLADKFEDKKIGVVVGPTVGGIIIAYEVAKNLGVKAIFAEREEGGRVFKRGFSLNEGQRVLIVDDILTTGKSIFEVIDLVKQYNAYIVGIGVFLDRSGGTVEMDYDLKPLVTVSAKTFKPEECPLCKAGEPIYKPGSRKN